MEKVVGILTLAYLFLQAVRDSKNGMVCWWTNTVAILFSIVVWHTGLWKFCSTWQEYARSLIETGLILGMLFLFTRNLPLVGKIMQPADGKALAVVYFTSVYLFGSYPASAVLFTTILIANSAFLFWYRGIKKASPKERKPYFPVLFCGYSGALFVAHMAYGI